MEKRTTSEESKYKAFESNVLKRGPLTKREAETQKTDISKRFQKRPAPITPTRVKYEDKEENKKIKKDSDDFDNRDMNLEASTDIVQPDSPLNELNEDIFSPRNVYQK